MSRSLVLVIRLRGAAFVLAAMLVATLSGCSSPSGAHRAVFPVKGQLFVDKKPAVGAVVWLHSIELVDGGASQATLAAEPRPRAIVQSDGSFEVSTYGEHDGAPVGRYRLAVFWIKNSGHGDGGDNLLPVRYQNPRNPELPIVEVKSAPNVLPALHLRAK